MQCFIEEWPDAENVEAPSHGKAHRTSIKEGDPSEKVAQYADNDQQREGTFPSSAAIRPITPMARTKRGKRFRDELTNRMRKREEEAEEKIKEDQEREEEAEEKIKEDQEREEEAEENIKEDQEREEEAEENIKED
uniref:Uncharacterized protein n=1 Tax=Globodera pallida TaxID=36090 RepID=A0A183CRD3_GLOPA